MRLLAVLSIFAAAHASDLSSPPFDYHYHESGRLFGNPIGAVRIPGRSGFHLYFVTSHDASDPGEAIKGSVGYSISHDLIDFDGREPVIEPESGCAIDGGSVVEKDRLLTIFYAQRCCPAECSIVVHRATSTNGKDWTKRGSTDGCASTKTLPSVVYDAVGERWVMAVVEGLSDAEEGYLPDFYTSTDGETWTLAGTFDPPDVNGDQMSFAQFSNTFLAPIEAGKWVLMGTRGKSHGAGPVHFIGNLNSDGVFVSDHKTLGRELFWDWAARPFPVWNHPEHATVVMTIMNHIDDDDLFKPLSLPLSVLPAGEGKMLAAWINSVKDLVVSGVSMGEFILQGKHHLASSSFNRNGLYSFAAEVFGLDASAFKISFESEEGATLYDVAFKRTPACLEVAHQYYVPTARMWTVCVPLSSEPSHRIAVMADRGVAEVIVDGWASRARWAYRLGPGSRIFVEGTGITLASGWRLDAVRSSASAISAGSTMVSVLLLRMFFL